MQRFQMPYHSDGLVDGIDVEFNDSIGQENRQQWLCGETFAMAEAFTKLRTSPPFLLSNNQRPWR